MTVREMIEQNEKLTLGQYACLSAESKGRDEPIAPCEIRSDFQRDRDRIIHCKAFRRLKHKTQVFLSPEGDHYRTRLTHTLEVAQIARTLARALRLNEDLTEAMALGHDLGHTPFGHMGERSLDKLSPHGFAHNEQSIRLVEKIEHNHRGLNLTFEVRDGILHHTGNTPAATLEGRILKFADRIAYVNHDIDDAVRAGLLKNEDIPKHLRDVLGNSHSERIETMIKAILSESADRPDIKMEASVQAASDELRTFMFDHVYAIPSARKEEEKVLGVITSIYEYLKAHKDKIPAEYLTLEEADGIDRVVCDYIACMSDRFAIAYYEDVFVPKIWQV